MIFPKLGSLVRHVALIACTVMLAGCMSDQDIDVTTGSRLEQPPANTKPEPPIEAGDIAIAGQQFSHSIRQLPEVTDAPKPPMVQFTGVTSIVNGPVDTEPYTDLLRDRLLLGDREKLRFEERQLPPLTSAHKKAHKNQPAAGVDEGNEPPDYQVLAELRGRIEADFYRIQIEFVNARTGQVLFNGVYRIRKEMPTTPNGAVSNDQPSVSEPNAMPMTRQGTDGGNAPQPVTPPPGGWQDANTGTSTTPVPPVFHE